MQLVSPLAVFNPQHIFREEKLRRQHEEEEEEEEEEMRRVKEIREGQLWQLRRSVSSGVGVGASVKLSSFLYILWQRNLPKQSKLLLGSL